MSVKNKQIYSKLTHINQQEQPCLKALRRKIRSYNKKLQDIKETEGKDFLRPEQLQKINRRGKYQSERDKCVDFVVVYRQILLENQQYYRAQQLKQIDDLSMILSVMQSENFRKKVQGSGQSILFGGSQKIQKDNMTLKQLYQNIRNTLTSVANSRQIKRMAKKYFDENIDEKINTVPKIIQWQSTQTFNGKISENKQNKKEQNMQDSTNLEQKSENINHLHQQQNYIQQQKQQIIQTENEKKSEENKNKVDENSQDVSGDMIDEQNQFEGEKKSRQKSEIIVHSKNYQNSQKPSNRDGEKKGGFKSADKLQQQKNPRTNRNPAHNIKFNRYKRSNSKQKYHEKARNQYGKNSKEKHRDQSQDEEQSDNNSDRPRKFNEQQIKQLEDDGFIVVGKPKIKKNVYSQYSGQPKRGNRQRNS